MTKRELHQLFNKWFDSVGFGDMTDREKDWLLFGFLLVTVTIITRPHSHHSSNCWKSTTTTPAKSGQHQASVALWIMRARLLIKRWENNYVACI